MKKVWVLYNSKVEKYFGADKFNFRTLNGEQMTINAVYDSKRRAVRFGDKESAENVALLFLCDDKNKKDWVAKEISVSDMI